jgi:hypothetical protein
MHNSGVQRRSHLSGRAVTVATSPPPPPPPSPKIKREGENVKTPPNAPTHPPARQMAHLNQRWRARWAAQMRCAVVCLLFAERFSRGLAVPTVSHQGALAASDGVSVSIGQPREELAAARQVGRSGGSATITDTHESGRGVEAGPGGVSVSALLVSQAHRAIAEGAVEAQSGGAAASHSEATGAVDLVMRNMIIVIAVGAVTALVVGSLFMYLLYRTGLGGLFSKATGVPDVRGALPSDALKAAQLDGVKDVGSEGDGGDGGGGAAGGAAGGAVKRSWLPNWGRRRG